jgi:hypothetical protein
LWRSADAGARREASRRNRETRDGTGSSGGSIPSFAGPRAGLAQSGRGLWFTGHSGMTSVPACAQPDLATSDGLVEQGYAAIARSARLLLLDLTGLSFCDARGLGTFVRIANHAQVTTIPARHRIDS